MDMFTTRKLPHIYRISRRNLLHYRSIEYQAVTLTATNARDVLLEALLALCQQSNQQHYHPLPASTLASWKPWLTMISHPQQLPKFVILVILTLEKELNRLLGRHHTYLIDHTHLQYAFHKDTVLIQTKIRPGPNAPQTPDAPSTFISIVIIADSLTFNTYYQVHKFHLKTIALLPDLTELTQLSRQSPLDHQFHLKPLSS